MHVVVYGATGKSGSLIVKELLSRGHKVTAVARHTSKVEPAEGLSVQFDDLSDAYKTAEVIRGADAVVSAYAPPSENTDQLIGVTKLQIEAVKQAGNVRLLVVGGAGGLFVAPGVTLLDSGFLPEAYLPIAKSHVEAFQVLKSSDIDWTYFAPAGLFAPGERTGQFRLGKDDLIADEKQESRISMEDYAIALVDELERPAHRQARFTIGY